MQSRALPKGDRRSSMRSTWNKGFVLICALAAMPVSSFAWGQSPSTQSTQPAGQTPPPKAAPNKKPPKPIDPDEVAGVRGSGSPLNVRVLMKGKTVENAHV